LDTGSEPDLNLAKCRRRRRCHFGQFLHLRKRSQDRLRACGDLTVFRRPAAATKKNKKELVRKVTTGHVEEKMPLESSHLLVKKLYYY